MNGELTGYNDSIGMRLRQVVAALDGLSAAQLNWRPYTGANSAYALAAHTLGNARAFIIGIAGGRDIGRDRPGEFASAAADAAHLREQAAELIREIEAVLGAIDPASLDDRFVPPKILWGESEPREITRRYAILQVVYHASLHLGHLEMTREMALAVDP